MPHEEHDESESEDEVGGHAPNQALPIANLPFSFDGVPQDGMEYLFTVRFSHQPFFIINQQTNSGRL